MMARRVSACQPTWTKGTLYVDNGTSLFLYIYGWDY